jgi:hypothetical protein
MQDGYVYILTNRAMPGLVKIGMTTRTPEQRIAELWQTGVPTAFDVFFAIRTPDPKRLEQMCHMTLSGVRVDESREFFAVGPDEARRTLQEHEDEVLSEWLARYRPGWSVTEPGCFVDPSFVHITACHFGVDPSVISDALSDVSPDRIADLVARASRRAGGGDSNGK